MNRAIVTQVLIGVAALFFLLSFLVQSAPAQEASIEKLQQRITELETRIVELENELEGCIKSRMGEGVSDVGWQNKKNWRRLHMGMPQKQVEAILGEPVKVISGYRTLWYYPNIYCGYVSFDEKGDVSGWSEP